MLTSGQPQMNENNAVAHALNADCTEVRGIGSADVPALPQSGPRRDSRGRVLPCKLR
jgi:hypothetical protein